ncbi:MAG: tetratricopeptide repeat protein [Gammaproteobacteria bacterium]|nr:MAG: tetratricopeptide repeat protein [Gammaproteobacteria bacterium]
MDDYLSEKEQIQAIKSWWKENGPFIIAGLVLGIAGLSGWNFWQNYKLERAEAAGAVYSDLVAAVDRFDLDLASASLEILESDYSSTPYLAQGRLMLAKLHVAKGEFPAAADQLESVVDETGDPELEQVARVRLARTLLAAEESTRALEVLDLSRAGAFEPRFHEVRGDILRSRGETAAAIEEYTRALEGPQDGVIDRQAVQLKLDSLGAPAGEPQVDPTGDA